MDLNPGPQVSEVTLSVPQCLLIGNFSLLNVMATTVGRTNSLFQRCTDNNSVF